MKKLYPPAFIRYNNARRLFVIMYLVCVLLGINVILGCGKQRELAPVTGKVTYRGEPLRFGAVVFQSEYGKSSTGVIQPDGTFKMVTVGEGDGAAVGKNRVQITCYESQSPEMNNAADFGMGERPLGKSLIPRKYLSWDTSGISVEVRPGDNDPLTLRLTD